MSNRRSPASARGRWLACRAMATTPAAATAPISLMDVRSAWGELEGELKDAFARVLDRGQFILAESVKAFEAEAAAYSGAGFAAGVGNGTDALCLALRALGVRAGDEVATVSYTFYATGEAVRAVGAVPVWVDVDPATYCMDPDDLAAKITPATKAVVVVSLFGHVADLDAIRRVAAEHGVPVLEDAAQSFGATYRGQRSGSLTEAATISFFPTKNLPALGDGGLVLSRDADVDERVRILRFHGSKDKRTFTEIGYNSRLDELQAAFLRVFLPHLDGWNARRRAVAAMYADAGLGDLVALPPADVGGVTPVYHLFVVRHPRRDEIAAALTAAGVAAAVYYRVPTHRQPAMADLAPAGPLPGTDACAAEGLALPMHPGLTAGDVDRVVDAVRAALAG